MHAATWSGSAGTPVQQKGFVVLGAAKPMLGLAQRKGRKTAPAGINPEVCIGGACKPCLSLTWFLTMNTGNLRWEEREQGFNLAECA